MDKPHVVLQVWPFWTTDEVFLNLKGRDPDELFQRRHGRLMVLFIQKCQGRAVDREAVLDRVEERKRRQIADAEIRLDASRKSVDARTRAQILVWAAAKRGWTPPESWEFGNDCSILLHDEMRCFGEFLIAIGSAAEDAVRIFAARANVVIQDLVTVRWNEWRNKLQYPEQERDILSNSLELSATRLKARFDRHVWDAASSGAMRAVTTAEASCRQETSELLDLLRIRAGMSYRQLANMLGVDDHKSVSAHCKGRRKLSPHRLELYARVFTRLLRVPIMAADLRAGILPAALRARLAA